MADKKLPSATGFWWDYVGDPLAPGSAAELIRDHVSPCVAVVSTEAAQQAIAKNAVEIDELLRPFGLVQKQLSHRAESGQIISIKRFRLRFMNLENIRRLNAAHSQKIVNECVKASCSTLAFSSPAIEVPELPNSLDAIEATKEAELLKDGSLMGRDGNQNEPPSLAMARELVKENISAQIDQLKRAHTHPWLRVYRECFWRLTRGQGHESLDIPVAVVVVCSSREDDPVGACQRAFNKSMLAQYLEGMDLNMLGDPVVSYLCLTDMDGQTDAGSAETVERLMRAFPNSNCHSMQINTKGLYPGDPADPNFVRRLMRERFGYKPYRQVIEEQATGQFSYAGGGKSSKDGIALSRSPDDGKSAYMPPLSGGKDRSVGGSATSPLGADEAAGDDTSSISQSTNLSSAAGGEADCEREVRSVGQLISQKDQQSLQQFVDQLADMVIVPHMQKVVEVLDEEVAKERRGLGKSLLSNARKWFAGGTHSPQERRSSELERSEIMSAYSVVRNSNVTSLAAPDRSMSSLGAPGMSDSIGSTGSFQSIGVDKSGDLSIGGNHISANGPASVLRKLADYAFMLHDYDHAISVYNTVRKDYQSEKSWVHYAGAQEMIAYAYFLNAGSNGEIQKAIEACMSSLMERRREFALVTRSMLLFAEMYVERRMHMEAIGGFLRIANGEDNHLRSALLLEMSALIFLSREPPQLRKFVFHLVLAGSHYAKASHSRHALRCYRQALVFYQHRDWAYASDHINARVARQSYHLGHLHKALESFASLLSSDISTQASMHVKDFIKVYRQALQKDQQQGQGAIDGSAPGSEQQVQALPVPRRQISTLSVECHDLFYSDPLPPVESLEEQDRERRASLAVATTTVMSMTTSGTAGEVPSPISIKDMEQELRNVCCAKDGTLSNPIESFALNRRSLLARHATTEDNDERTVVVCNEPLKITIDLYNHLQIPLELHNVKLKVSQLDDFEAGPYGQLETPGIETLEIREGVTLRHEFQVIPREPNTSFRIDGIDYVLGNVLEAHAPFKLRGRRLNQTADQRKHPTYADDRRLEVEVVEPMPLLAMDLPQYPERLLVGEEREAELSLRNEGPTDARVLALACDHPDVLVLTTVRASLKTEQRQLLDQKYPHCTPLDLTIPKGQVQTVKLALKGRRACAAIEILIAYAAPPSAPVGPERRRKLPVRLLRRSAKLELRPSISLGFKTMPSAQRIGGMTVVADVHSAIDCAVTALEVISGAWEIETCISKAMVAAGGCLLSLKKGSEEALFVKMRRIRRSSVSDTGGDHPLQAMFMDADGTVQRRPAAKTMDSSTDSTAVQLRMRWEEVGTGHQGWIEATLPLSVTELTALRADMPDPQLLLAQRASMAASALPDATALGLGLTSNNSLAVASAQEIAGADGLEQHQPTMVALGTGGRPLSIVHAVMEPFGPVMLDSGGGVAIAPTLVTVRNIAKHPALITLQLHDGQQQQVHHTSSVSGADGGSLAPIGSGRKSLGYGFDAMTQRSTGQAQATPANASAGHHHGPHHTQPFAFIGQLEQTVVLQPGASHVFRVRLLFTRPGVFNVNRYTVSAQLVQDGDRYLYSLPPMSANCILHRPLYQCNVRVVSGGSEQPPQQPPEATVKTASAETPDPFVSAGMTAA
eukprot:Clim_evm72s146 gene=Clim_evmTU72s146